MRHSPADWIDHRARRFSILGLVGRALQKSMSIPMPVLIPTPRQINYSLISFGLKKNQVCEMPHDGYPNYLIKRRYSAVSLKTIGNGRR